MNNVRQRTRLVALSAMLTALSVVFIYLSAVAPTMQLALAAIAGLLPALSVLAGGLKWGFLTYAASGLLAAFICPDKGSAFAYILLFGHWPMLKSILERKIRRRAVEWTLKLVCCNLLFTLLFAAVKLFGIDVGELGLPVWAFYIAGNICFVLYDRCFTVLIAAFGGRFLKIFKKM